MAKRADLSTQETVERLEAVTRQLTHALKLVQGQRPNYFRAMVRLLRGYPKMQQLVGDEREYMTLKEHDHSISIAPPPGTEVRDENSKREERLEERASAYQRTLEQFQILDRVVRQFENDSRFIAISMYDFGADCNGEIRERDRPYTWEEIADELSAVGRNVSERTLRMWRSKLIQEMAVLMFGADGALSLEMPRERGDNENPH